MAGMTDVLMQIDGRPASAADLGHFVLSNYGAFTSMQVEDGEGRGLDLHLARLEAEAVDLFGVAVPEAALRERMRQVLDGRSGRFSLRVNLFSDAISLRAPDAVVQPRVLTTLSPPASPLTQSLRLQTQVYAREVPHLKHAATFGLTRARRLAVLAGFDDALFVDGEGRISEGSIWNIGFVQGETVVWPEAPMLTGTGQALLQRGMADLGLSSVTRPVHLSDLASFDAAFICNSATPACAVASIDGHQFGPADDLIARLIEAWRSNPCQTI
ncbi:class IV aminotransferase [Brevundimonas sp. MYb46]|nr:class IV aminotransferase [Brevundimonas sp. MYb31]PRA24042.1 class IV aminotransferase [Brevundimonas sp. MYb27]PRB17065.1 class IV aminotransferase [Brevundimonas sp. MYb52]PRB34762.1 class IV aminotransferase [Brevundimonas sp. MYb46]PRB54787.1 class IV aminotransferase [Brevundimonas sp. MYb33]